MINQMESRIKEERKIMVSKGGVPNRNLWIQRKGFAKSPLTGGMSD